MAMNRQQKEAVISSLKENFETSSASFVVGVNGLTVSQFETLKKDLRKEGGSLKVTKVRLMKRALDGASYAQDLEPFLKEQIALVFAKQEAPSVAKVLCGFAKDHEKFAIVAGCMEDAVIDSAAVKTIASLPSREVLLAQLAGTLNAPIVGFASVLHQMLARLVYALKAVEEQKK